MSKIINKLIWIIAIYGFIGFLDATYLTIVHYKGAELNCSEWGSCNTVTTSEYSVIFGVPMALMGALYYFTVLFLSLIYIDSKAKISLKLIPIITTFGFLFSLYLIYLQLFVLNAICIYCMFSAGISTINFILGMIVYKKQKAIPSN